MQQWVEDTLRKIGEKEYATVVRNKHRVPYRAIDGVFEDMGCERIDWWTNGFWGGILWQLYHITGDGMYRAEAEALEKRMDAVLMNAAVMDHDSGFRWLPTAVINFRLTGNHASFNRGILAADNLAGRLNSAGRYIRAWNNGREHAGWAIIDCMMNLPLLFWASAQQKDPRYAQIARIHADRTLECFVRENGSVRHIVSFDPETGLEREALGGQGLDADSSWTRGQAWALYGFTLAYRDSGDPRYLAAAEKIAAYVIAQMDESGLIPVDFGQPADCDFEDSSAAAALASALIELANTVENGESYRQSAVRLLRALDAKRADYNPETDGILHHCSVRFFENNHNQRLVYADYFYLEALLKLAGKNLTIW